VSNLLDKSNNYLELEYLLLLVLALVLFQILNIDIYLHS